jgi:hypothetical protein
MIREGEFSQFNATKKTALNGISSAVSVKGEDGDMAVVIGSSVPPKIEPRYAPLEQSIQHRVNRQTPAHIDERNIVDIIRGCRLFEGDPQRLPTLGGYFHDALPIVQEEGLKVDFVAAKILCAK